jgi:hypothetical protein
MSLIADERINVEADRSVEMVDLIRNQGRSVLGLVLGEPAPNGSGDDGGGDPAVIAMLLADDALDATRDRASGQRCKQPLLDPS